MSSLISPIPRIDQRQDYDASGGVGAYSIDDMHIFQRHRYSPARQ